MDAKPIVESLSALECLVGNPYDADLRQRRRDWEEAGVLPAEDAGEIAWRDWWSGLPPAVLLDESSALGLMMGLAGRSPSEAGLRGAARLLHALKVTDVERSVEVVARALAVKGGLDRMKGDSGDMEKVRKDAWAAAFGRGLDKVRGLAPLIQTTPVLVRGETGTGNELVAQALCRSMPGTWDAKAGWKPAPWEAVHLASIPESLVDDVLFGMKG